jgi:hypothetical protein
MNGSAKPRTDGLGWLRGAWKAGLDIEEAGTLDLDEVKTEARARLDQNETAEPDPKSINSAD